MRVVKKDDRGYAVLDIQRRLKKIGFTNLDHDGIYGPLTSSAIANFQQDRGLLATGNVDEETWQELVESSYRIGERTVYLKQPHFKGDDVRTIQIWLRTLGFNPGPIDSSYGRGTEQALKEFQHNVGLKTDGIASQETINTFLNLRSAIERNAEIDFPEKEPEKSLLSPLYNLKVLLDAGHGGKDGGAIGPSGLKESNVCNNIGLRIANLLKMLGAQVGFTKKESTVEKRIALANKLAYPLLISIHLNHSVNPKAEGSSCYYFAKDKIISQKGKKLAKSIQRELVRMLGTKDCRIHGKNFNILRQTKAVAVMLEPCFISNNYEEKMLKDEEYLQKIAYAIFDGIKNYLEDRN